MRGGSLKRRLEMIFGGPARPFELTVADADLLASACNAYEREYADTARTENPPRDEADVIADASVYGRLVELRQRLLQHAGYGTER